MSGDGGRRHCIRDLAALNALPSMCIGRSHDETLDIVLAALPQALSCELVFLSLPGSPPKDHAVVLGAALTETALAPLKSALSVALDGIRVVTLPGIGDVWCLEAEMPVGSARGRLVAGRTTPPDLETDRVLVRSAANIVGTTLEAASERAARSGFRILVVDDNVDIAELLSEALTEAGFETAMAHDGRAALERWCTFRPHAAVLDVGLPELDGYDLARALRAEHGTTPLLIAATGYGQRSDRVAAAAAGFDLHFVKPVSVHDLVVVLDERIVMPG